MANADFSQKQNSNPGGFDAGSYREQKQPEQAVPLTPLQQKLAGLEAKLPATLSTRAAALALSVVVMLAAFLGFGSAKLRSRYNEARKWYTVGVAADNGYNLSEELTTRMNTAANIITTAGNTLGTDSAEVQAAQTALNDFSACLEAVQNGGKAQALTSLPYYQGEKCPLAAVCRARAAGTAPELPHKAAPKPRRTEPVTLALLESPAGFLLQQRPAKGLLAGLWQPVLWEGEALAAEEVLARLRAMGLDTGCAAPDALPAAKHIFSHIEWHMRGILLHLPAQDAPAGCVWASREALQAEYTLPGAFKSYKKLMV